MLHKIKQIIEQVSAVNKPQYVYSRVYRPEPPLGFVPRTDPNFYFLQKKF